MSSLWIKIRWWLFAALCVSVGLYPISYFLLDREFGLLSTKTPELLTNLFWNVGFYAHIIFGGLALLVGWTQFMEKLRLSRLEIHRLLGKFYVFSALISGISAVYIAIHATGGIISSLGFGLLGILWLSTTSIAFISIRRREVEMHKKMMIYSYALCFAAVTLRIWLPMLTFITDDFIIAYQIVAWLCWVPNFLVAFIMVNKMNHQIRPQEV